MKRPIKQLNSTLTGRIISLHQSGYVNDFSIISSTYVQCLQTGETFL
ncbi:hypothetical protein [Mucilaginibacter auburnensis]|uniref:Uncharacterized protein n=1 Tax=Mucilaginibacter auburnensis TaxID=1457233 RepID=A0A2H9VW62_9SPHI|nr:hypothetical protein [Mucilaginibacter auburnensis]PJJ85032.1 hypothetical protein CLV57_2055 [Mucilaginibacter auburnensis]